MAESPQISAPIYNSYASGGQTISLADAGRISQMKMAFEAYYGRLPRPLRARPRQSDDSVMVNRCRPVVDKGVSFLFGSDITFEVQADDDGDGTEAQEYLDGFWKQNRQMTLLQRLALTGGITGHAMFKILPPTPGSKYPRLVVLDPSNVVVYTDPDDCETVLEYHIMYDRLDQSGNIAREVRQVIQRLPNGTWLILDQEKGAKDKGWTTNRTVNWPYPFAPIAACQNLPAPGEYWGLSDTGPDLIQLNKDLNFVLSNINRILRYHAHPKTWGKGFNADQLKIAIDETVVLQADNAEMHNLEMTSDLHSSLNFADTIRGAMDELSRVPALSLGVLKDVPRGTVSGVALQIMYEPLVEKTELKRRLYGDMLTELCQNILVMAGFAPDDAEVVIHWQSLLPADDMAEAQTAVLWSQLGISRSTILSRLGFDADTEADQIAKEEEDGTAIKPQPALNDQAPANAAPGDGNANDSSGDSYDGDGDLHTANGAAHPAMASMSNN